ncbi:hypothetical protein GWK47_020186 [Chionoecetes opilio]|uniref:Uncharacterized protein n=1 Tax=Chionoecetes opilio TaxID=41210 RepID=A0A8J5CFB8_CHIOP|nr:hypothetical protein GWK47_020186 [Chionoecetes opilio]
MPIGVDVQAGVSDVAAASSVKLLWAIPVWERHTIPYTSPGTVHHCYPHSIRLPATVCVGQLREHGIQVLEGYSEDALPGKKIMVITVASAQGCFKNVIDLEQFHSLLDSYQLIHFPWKEQEMIQLLRVQ